MKLYVTVMTANDGRDYPSVFIGKSKKKIIEQIKEEVLFGEESLWDEHKDEILEALEEGSIYTEFTEFPCSVYNYEKEI